MFLDAICDLCVNTFPDLPERICSYAQRYGCDKFSFMVFNVVSASVNSVNTEQSVHERCKLHIHHDDC